MARLRDQGICLRESDWSETSQVVTVLTKEHGIVRGLAKGARRASASFSDGFELLSVGELLWISRPANQLSTVTSWSVLRTFRSPSDSWGAFVSWMYVVQVIASLVREDDPHPRIFDRLCAVLTSPGTVGEDLLRTQWLVLEDLGYALNLDNDILLGTQLAADGSMRYLPHRGGFSNRAFGSENSLGVRASTIDCLRRAREGIDAGEDQQVLGRGIRLMHEAIRTVLGHDLGAWSAVEAWIAGWR